MSKHNLWASKPVGQKSANLLDIVSILYILSPGCCSALRLKSPGSEGGPSGVQPQCPSLCLVLPWTPGSQKDSKPSSLRNPAKVNTDQS